MRCVGLAGELNRKKLSERFLRPTSWNDYCTEVSSSNCQVDDGIASRPPVSQTEEESFFAAGSYTGYFRATDKNNCDLNPHSCTGHFADYPCYFSGSVEQTAYHLNIALESDGEGTTNGYTYSQMTQIWDAANATKSDVMMIWWESEALYQSYLGTDAEFTKIVLPPPTQTCLNNMVYGDRCGMNLDNRRGKPEGACDFSPRFLSTVVSTSLKEDKHQRPELLRSPAYEALTNFRISELQIGQIFELWLSRGIDKYNFDPRWATCRWVADNIDTIRSFVPSTHPRVVETEDLKKHPLFVGASVLSMSVVILLGFSALFTRIKRRNKAIFYAQEGFLYAIVSGLGFLAIGSLILALPPSDATCVSAAWLTNLGYVVTFSPLFARIHAICVTLQSGKNMQRVRMTTRKLLGTMFCIASLVTAFLMLWTLLDTPRKISNYELADVESESAETTIIREMQSCGSEQDFWMLLSFVWQGLLLLACLMFVFMALLVKEDMNDTRSMSVTVSLHCGFFLSRLLLWVFRTSIDPNKAMGYLSLLMSLECLSVVTVYIAPKLMERSKESDISEADPDLFIGTTVIMVEVAGFSAWSSVREPVQVFKFLEIVHGCFDDILDKRKLFKVETSGGCYVAAAGIPRAKADHTLIAARFAWDCMQAMKSLTHELEMLFGPDTSNLTLRVGIHSGPVTGGFLKGKGARFQLFGDTVNTTVQIVRTCETGRIQLSSDAAKLLTQIGKGRWLQERLDPIQTINRGSMKTYWLNRTKANTKNEEGDNEEGSSGCGSDMDIPGQHSDETESEAHRQRRLIEWNVNVLMKLIKHIVARRSIATATKAGETGVIGRSNTSADRDDSAHASQVISTNRSDSQSYPSTPLDEVKEIIALPAFDRRAAMKHQKDIESIVISNTVSEQLHYFVTTIAQMYRDNPFHNFFHASHVVMAVTKFMNRINEARELDLGDYKETKMQDKKYASALHDHTYGITSDPLTQFACVFSALIHDVDHPGVPNPQLVRENETLAATYRGRSVAEQNSFDLAWDLFMDNRFQDLRASICATPTELLRFRQLVINSVMATDLGDKELKELRNGRWLKAFSNPSTDGSSGEENGSSSAGAGSNGSGHACSATAGDDVNRKATIVVEHLIQAADVSHTTQHWEVYRAWNENLFRELYKAYCDGRAERNPADYWYEGEIGFFDYYIIPLAKKLRDCGVFGLTSDENLNYAMHNRQLWVEKGVIAVAEMLERAQLDFRSDAVDVNHVSEQPSSL